MNRRLWHPHMAFITIVFRPRVVVLVKNRSVDWIRKVHDDERDELPRHCDLCSERAQQDWGCLLMSSDKREV